jgi:hypothetical protein
VPTQVELGQGVVIDIPRTRQELRALRDRRSELSGQLSSATDRRERLAREITSASGSDRSGLEQHLAVLDKRILQLETDLARTGQALTMAPAPLLAGPEAGLIFGTFREETFAGLTAVFFIFVLGPIAFGIARRMWKRAKVVPATQEAVIAGARLERIEQAVDAIAIEVERISEAQRFTTKLMSESKQATPALAAAQNPAEPLRMREYDAIRASREGS